MCVKVCHKLADDEQPPVPEVPVETVSEERANRCLQRIDLLNKVRNDVYKNEHFDEWIMTRCAPSADLPDWYIPGEHDRDLVRAATRYGITRTEFYYVQDAELSFKKYLYKYLKHIETLMAQDALVALTAPPESAESDPIETALRNQDPIQYYFQNQAKIQVTFRELLNREQQQRKEKEEKKAATVVEVEAPPKEKDDESMLLDDEKKDSESDEKVEDEKKSDESENKGNQVNYI